MNILIAAGGTGGHLFPALAVAEQIKTLTNGNVNFHFFGRSDKIEGRIVPKLGTFHTTNLTGYNGIASLNTWMLPFRIMRDTNKLAKVIKGNRIDAVLCAGAYLSYPAGLAAKRCGVKLFLMESNVNPGKAISKLAGHCTLLFTTFDETAKYFPASMKERIRNYGNPVRKEILQNVDKQNARKYFGLNENSEKKVLLIFGGSLGARAINNAVIGALDELAKLDIQVIWQTGGTDSINIKLPPNVKRVDFIDDMASAYAMADVVVCRSGATTVAELTITGKPAILVPLPSASNNEQYFNAKYLSEHSAAVIVNNADIGKQFFKEVTELITDEKRLQTMRENSKKLARPDASKRIAQEVIKMITQ